VCLRAHYHGIAALDCSTGELALLRVEPSDEALRDELARLRPAELIASEADRPRLLALAGSTPTSWVDPGDFDARAAVERLQTLLRSEEHTSELQSHLNLVCRLLLGKKKLGQSNGGDRCGDAGAWKYSGQVRWR